MRSGESNKPRLEDHRGKNHPLHRMPFVSTGKRSGDNFWDVPPVGTHEGGYTTGEALATIFLKHLREGGKVNPAGNLGLIVGSMIDHCAAAGYLPGEYTTVDPPEEHDAIRGQLAGFFNTISEALIAGARFCGSPLDSIDYADALDRANAGLAYSQADLDKELAEMEARHKAARRKAA
jgi:hypothetical protein